VTASFLWLQGVSIPKCQLSFSKSPVLQKNPKFPSPYLKPQRFHLTLTIRIKRTQKFPKDWTKLIKHEPAYQNFTNTIRRRIPNLPKILTIPYMSSFLTNKNMIPILLHTQIIEGKWFSVLLLKVLDPRHVGVVQPKKYAGSNFLVYFHSLWNSKAML